MAKARTKLNRLERAKADTVKILDLLKVRSGTIPDLTKRSGLLQKVVRAIVYREMKAGSLSTVEGERKSKFNTYQLTEQSGEGPMSDKEFRLLFRRVTAEIDRRLVEFEALKKWLRAKGAS
jgi:hypothetical protein